MFQKFFHTLRRVMAAGFVLITVASSAFAQDVLRPEEAFRYQTEIRGDEVLVRWIIEPEHYLYRDRMGVSGLTPGIEVGEPVFPQGELHADEFFGEMEIYRDEAVVRIPFKRSEGAPDELELELRLQGCADFGLCYPPQKWTTTLPLASSEPSRASVQDTGDLREWLNSTSRADDQLLPPDRAFRPFIGVSDPFNLRVTWVIAEGYYLYRDSISVSTNADGIQTGTLMLPSGTPESDEYFGDTQVFYRDAVATVPLSRATPEPRTIDVRIEYRGCKKDSICYPPQVRLMSVELPRATAADRPRSIAPLESEQDRLFAMIARGNLFTVLAAFMGFGLLLAFTPCVLPMIPILSGIIAGQGAEVTTHRAFLLSLTYVLGMSITYSIAGALFALAGQQVQAVFQDPWIIVGVAALFIVLALAMFGLYELQLPAAWQTRLTAISSQRKAGTYAGTIFMGALSALVVTACVAPPLVAALAVVAETGDMLRGGLALFALSLGMGLPLIVIGTSAGKLLPKAGAWMNGIKGTFGFLLLGLAVWMLDRILPGEITMGLWALLVFMAGVFLGAFRPLTEPSGPSHKLGKGFGLLAVLYGATLLIGALTGAQNPLQPLQRIGGTSVATPELEFKRIKSVSDLDSELQRAAELERTVMLDFYADWCVSCKEMEHFTFSDPAVQTALSATVLLQADVTANDELDQALMRRFGIFGPPTIVFFDRQGTEVRAGRVIGYVPADEFLVHLKTVMN